MTLLLWILLAYTLYRRFLQASFGTVKRKRLSMQLPSLSAHFGTIMRILGVVLILSSSLLLFVVYPILRTFELWWLLIPLPLILLGISTFAYFRKLPHWLLALYCGVSVLGFLLQMLAYIVFQALTCFDSCIPERTAILSLLLLGLSGFLLSGLGAFVTLRRS